MPSWIWGSRMKKLKLRDEDQVSPEERMELIGDATARVVDRIITKASQDATRQGDLMKPDGGLERASMQLRSFVERVERLKEEIKALQDDVSYVMQEAKANGFDTAVIKDVIKLRGMDCPAERLEMLSLYWRRMGGNWPS
jgi:uncharacterized protein (UPF0335 family)